MSLLKYTVYGRTPPSYDVPIEEHCCDCEGCWGGYEPKECPYMVPQVCMLCGAKSTFALSLEREQEGKTIFNHSHAGSVCFWVCDKHCEDKKLLSVLKKGVPSSTARSKAKLISFVRKAMEKDLI